MTNKKKNTIIDKSSKEEDIKPHSKLITAIQAFESIGGNVRLKTFISKKFSGVKYLDSWRDEFEKQKLL